MKAFVFKPSEVERYTHGGIIVIAETFEQAANILFEASGEYSKNRAFMKESDVPKERDYSIQAWVLELTLELSGKHEPGIAFCNWDCA